jgi:NADH-quinone oxidoreductase subunit N
MELWAIVPELVLGGGVLVTLPLGTVARGRRRWIVTVVALAVLAVAAGATARMIRWPARTVFDGTYVVDPFAAYFKLFAIVATALTLLVTHDRLRGLVHQGAVPPLLLLTCLGATALAASQNLALVALFIQLVAVGSYVLVGIAKDRRAATEGALKLFLFAAATGAVMLYGMSLLFGLSGTLALDELAPRLAAAPRAAVIAGAALVLVGYGYEITLVPFHAWAPDSYQGAVTPVSGYVAVVPKAAGLAVLLRTALVAFPSECTWPVAVAILAAITMSVGNLLAMTQSSVKRMIACSSIAQVGYLLVAAAASRHGALGRPALMLYLAVYLFMELGAFLSLSVIEGGTGSDELGALSGAGRRHPLPAGVLALSLLSLAGIPPLGGFVAKAVVFAAALEARWIWLAAIMAVNMAASLYYFARVLEATYLRPPEGGAARHAPPRTPRVTRLALLVLAAGAVAIGVFPAPWVVIARDSAPMFGATPPGSRIESSVDTMEPK